LNNYQNKSNPVLNHKSKQDSSGLNEKYFKGKLRFKQPRALLISESPCYKTLINVHFKSQSNTYTIAFESTNDACYEI